MRRKQTPHRNPHKPQDIDKVLQWALIHRESCEECRHKTPRKFVMPYPETWAENYNQVVTE